MIAPISTGPFKKIRSLLSARTRKSTAITLIGTAKAAFSKKEIFDPPEADFQPKIASKRKKPGRTKTNGKVRTSFVKSKIIRWRFLISKIRKKYFQ